MIVKILREEEQLCCTQVVVAKYLKKSEGTGSLSRCSGSSGPTKITDEIKVIFEQQMQRNDETTAVKLHHFLNNKHGYSMVQNFSGLDISQQCVLSVNLIC